MRVYYDIREKILQYRLARRWEQTGRSGPPPHLIKEKALQQYAQRFSAEVLIETGTFLGEMVYANRNRFRKIVSIELDRTLYEKAKQRFKKYPHITIVLGDSATVLPMVLKNEVAKCLFWLDGHYSGGDTAKGESETPVLEELRHIKASGDRHVVLIDDARLFRGANDYPELNDFESFVLELWPGNVFEVRDDIIRIHPADVRTKG